MLAEDDIREIREVLNTEILTPSGWCKVTHVCRTVPLPVCVITTPNRSLTCADKHLLRGLTKFIYASESLNQEVLTIDGWEKVTRVQISGDLKEMYDLRVDSEDHVYFCDGFASHNSTGIGAKILTEMNLFRNRKMLYLAPLAEQIKTFSTRLNDMQKCSIFNQARAAKLKLRNHLQFKESDMGGNVRLMHILTDPSKVRGISAGFVAVDECQNFDSEFLPEIRQVQKNFPDNRFTLFAGTSLDLSTTLEAKFQEGSRGIWHIRGRKKWFSLNDPETIFSILKPDGLRCPETGERLNPNNGEFVHESPRMLAKGFPSFHMPQLIVPAYSSGEGYIEIWNEYKTDERKFLMEVMGIPVTEGLTEITENDLKACCSDLSFEQTQKLWQTGKLKFRYIVSGCDWGGSDWNAASRTKKSYTVHTIYGVTADGKFHLLHAHRYAGQHYQDIGGQIVNNHVKFGGAAVGADNGAGAYYNAHLADSGKIPRNRVFVFQYTDTKMFVERIDNPVFSTYSLHRTDSLSAVFNDIRERRFIFPKWEDSKGFLLDCLNLRRNVTETQSGRGIMRYMKDGRYADDFLQSTNYGITLMRLMIGESMIPNKHAVQEVSRIMAGNPVGMMSPSVIIGSSYSG